MPQIQSSTEFGDEMKAVGQFLKHFASFFALLRLSGVQRQFFELSSAHTCECSRAPAGLPIIDCGAVDIHTLIASSEQQQQQQQQQYNLERLRFNRRGASTPLWGVEAWSPPSRRPNPIPAIPPHVVRTPHLHAALTTQETVKL